MKGMKKSSLQKRLSEWVERDNKLSGSGKISGSRYSDDREFEKEVSDFASNKS